MLGVRCVLTLFLLLGALLAVSGNANALVSPGDLCKTMMFMDDSDGPVHPLYFLFTVFDAANDALDAIEALVPVPHVPTDGEGSPSSENSMTAICIHWLNVCGPMAQAIPRRL